MIRATVNAAYLLLAGAILLAFVAAILLFQPLLGAISSTRTELAAATVRSEERNAFLKNLDRKQTTLRSQEVNERMLNVALPSDEAFEDLTRVLHRAATAAGGTLTDVSNATAVQQRNSTIRRSQGATNAVPASVTELSAGLKFKGTYQQTRVFLEQLERAPRFIAVDNLKLQRDGAAALDQLTVELNIRFYREGGKP